MNPYQPDNLPLTNLDYRKLLPLVGQANAALARYDGLLQGIPNPSVMLSPLTTQEAVLSSRIEGTQATVDEVLEQEAGLLKEGEKFQDILEISNYRQALFAAREYLKDYPIRLSFVRELHRTLMNSVRGKDKTPGEFRKDQNWIGKFGCSIEQASFVPPNPMQLIGFLQEWEYYLDSDDIDFLLQTAVVHAQFELLHPFKDGNGRIGRILIPLFLYQKKILSQPMFYMSEYLESHRKEYYARLKGISTDCDWDGWIAFFLQAVIAQANQNGERVSEIIRLYEDMKEQIHKITRSQYTVHLLDALFDRPIFGSSHLIRHTEIPAASVKSFISKLKKAGILVDIRPAGGRQPAIMAFVRLLNITEGKNVF